VVYYPVSASSESAFENGVFDKMGEPVARWILVPAADTNGGAAVFNTRVGALDVYNSQSVVKT